MFIFENQFWGMNYCSNFGTIKKAQFGAFYFKKSLKITSSLTKSKLRQDYIQ